MARKRTEEPTETPAAEAPVAKITKADAVRAAVADGADNPSEGAAYIKAKFNIDITPQQFSTYKSIEKKRTGALTRRGRKPHEEVVHVAANAPVGLANQIEAIKSLVDKLGVDEVVNIARLFGK